MIINSLQEICPVATTFLATTLKLLLNITYQQRLFKVVADNQSISTTSMSLLKIVANVKKYLYQRRQTCRR
jgi:hypothetical protein